MDIVISKVLKSKSAIFHDEGLQIYDFLERAFNQNREVNLSFEGVKNCSTQFLNACIGKLYLSYPMGKIESLLNLKSIEDNRRLSSSIKKVIDNARNAEKYNQILDEALEEV